MPSSQHIFISHAPADDDFVKELRIKLELHQLKVWVDSRNLRGGGQLRSEIETAIEKAAYVLVVLSPKTINSAWVRKEIKLAEKIAKQRPDFRVIPLLLEDVEPSALELWFEKEPTGINIQMAVGQLDEKLPDILAALGQRLPDDVEPPTEVPSQPVAELLLNLYNPRLTQKEDNSFALRSDATLTYIPANPIQPQVQSQRFIFTSPIQQLDLDDIRWYLEKYAIWPTGLFQKQAQEIEARLPVLGQALYHCIFDKKACQLAIDAWLQTTDHQRFFSVQIEAALPEGSGQNAQKNASIVASKLTSLPWELLHDGQNWLSDGANPVRIRRRLPNYHNQAPLLTDLPIRILLLSPRPEQKGVAYIDHRASAKPLVEAVANLGDLVTLTVLSPPTLPALQAELKRAQAAKQPYHVLHFDGHGIYNPHCGLGALCFESPQDSDKLSQRAMQLVYAKYQKGITETENNIASLLHQYRIPLVFLDACQTAQTDINPNASVAASLLEEGVASVVAMSHSVLVKSATIFVTAFYQALAQGQRLGQAMLAGQQAMMADTFRFHILGAGELHLRDWFVPILYQEQHDPQLFHHIPSRQAVKMQAQQQQHRLGHLPDTPSHSFIGRSYELLMLERLLEQQPYAVIRGQGGIGKTTIAVELARWLVQSGRYQRCAFVSVEAYSHDRAVIDELGKQLVGEHYSVAEYADLNQAMQPLQRVFDNEACLMVVDNMESLLADSTNTQPVLNALQQLHKHDNKTRLLFTSRERLPAPFNHKLRHIELGQLSLDDAKALIMQVMAEQGLNLKHDERGQTPEQVNDLVKAVNGHARALVLLARELASQGLTTTTENLQRIMHQLEQAHHGKRELSLFASVELSLQRLSPQSRQQVQGLAVFYDGGNLWAISEILSIEVEAAQQLALELIQVGLAEEKAYRYLRLDPALPAYLGLQLSAEQKALFTARWSAVMAQLVDFLYQQIFEDTKLAFNLTLLELPNLITYIRQLKQQLAAGQADADTVSSKAGSLEQLLAQLNRPQALAEVVNIRQYASQHLKTWNHARFQNERLTIERLLTQGELQAAFQQAQKLLQAAKQADYARADYDLAIATYYLGRVLKQGGAAAEALPVLQQALQSFEALGERGARMASVSLAELGDCLTDLGRLEQAVAAYQENIKRAEKLQDIRQVAIGKGQLAYVRLEQKDYAAALQAYQDALILFQQLDEPASQAVIHHQIGMVYREQHNRRAETAYKQALAIFSQQGNRAGEAASLGELGNLYKDWQRPEQAVAYYRQAADICSQLEDLRHEGFWRSNLAATLLKLNRLDPARVELLRAIDCGKSFGHVSEPWKAQSVLFNLEQAAGNAKAAQDARQHAIQAFLAYRQDGGENHSGTGRLAVAVLNAIQQQDTAAVQQEIAQFLEQEDRQAFKTYLQRLQTIIQGQRDPALAEDDEMPYNGVVELKMLLAQLASKPSKQVK